MKEKQTTWTTEEVENDVKKDFKAIIIQKARHELPNISDAALTVWAEKMLQQFSWCEGYVTSREWQGIWFDSWVWMIGELKKT